MKATMKNTTLFVGRAGAIALLAMTITACAGEALDAPDTDKNEQLITVEAGAELRANKPQTRLDYTDNTNGVTVKWKYSATDSENEKFTVFQNTNRHVFALKDDPTLDGASGSFSGQLAASGTEQTLYAFYPAGAVPTTATNDNVVLNIAAQKGSLEGLSEKDYMTAFAEWSSASDALTFQFIHQMAMLCINTELSATYKVANVVVTGLNNEQTLNLSTGEWSTPVEGKITLSNIKQPAGINHTFYLMVFPTISMKRLNIVINLKDGGNYTKIFSSTTAITLEAAKRYSINVGNPSDVPGGSEDEDMGGGGSTGGIPWS